MSNHSYKAFSIIIALPLTIIGCATVTTQTSYESGSSVPLGHRTTARVGDVVYSEFDYTSNSVARLIDKAEGSFLQSRREVPQGTQLVGLESDGVAAYCAPATTFMLPACFQDSDDDGKFDKAFTMNQYGALFYGNEINPPLAYRKQEILADAGGFKYELIYQGLDNDVLKFGYREYLDNMARPAFQQDLSYTLEDAGDTELSFRDVRMIVHKATNNQIEYTVISGFNK